MITAHTTDALEQADDPFAADVALDEQSGQIIALLGSGVSPERVCTALNVSMDEIKRACLAAGAK